jgi:hypothetical protein
MLKRISTHGPIRHWDVCALLVTRNQAELLEKNIAHHQRLGFTRFLVVDDYSSDETSEILFRNRADVFMPLEVDSYGENNYGNDWRNAIARDYLRNKWFLNIDTDELLIYDNFEHYSAVDLIDMLDRYGVQRAFTPLIDFYDVTLSSRNRSDWNLFKEYPYFEYSFLEQGTCKEGFYRTGGVLSRTIKDGLSANRSLGKFSLLRYTSDTVLDNIHFPKPYGLNSFNSFAALAHFAYGPDFIQKVRDTTERKQYFASSSFYSGIKASDLQEHLVDGKNTAYFVSSQSLIERGLIAKNDYWSESPVVFETSQARAALDGTRLVKQIDGDPSFPDRYSYKAASLVASHSYFKDFAPSKLRVADPVCLCVIRNERARLPHFIRHYRKIGVTSFVFFDNGSMDGSIEYLTQNPDCHVIPINASYRVHCFGNVWITAFCDSFLRDRWCLIADADELLVYDGMESHSVSDLCRILTSMRASRVFGPLVDMYPPGGLDSAVLSDDMNLLELSPLFDGPENHEAFRYKVGRSNRGWWLSGGIRYRAFSKRRLFKRPKVTFRPALAKYPLVFWSSDTAIADIHTPSPAYLNHCPRFAALLHFKFLSDFHNRAIQAVSSGEHYDNSSEYSLYIRMYKKLRSGLVNRHSRRFHGPHSLIECGIMEPINWPEDPDDKRIASIQQV